MLGKNVGEMLRTNKIRGHNVPIIFLQKTVSRNDVSPVDILVYVNFKSALTELF